MLITRHFIAVVSPVDSCAATCAQPVDKGIDSFGTVQWNSLVSTEMFLLISVKCSSNVFPKTLTQILFLAFPEKKTSTANKLH